MPLTDSILKSHLNKNTDKQIILTDRDSMSVRITPKGKIVFQYRYRLFGKQKRYDIGVYPIMSLAEARAQVPKLRSLAAQEKDLKKALNKKEATVQAPNLEACIDYFMEKYVSKLRNSTQATYKSELRHRVKGVFNQPVELITRSEWYQFFDEVEQNASGYVAKTLLKRLKTCLSFCLDREFIKSHSLASVITHRVGDNSKVRDRTPSVEEIKAIFVELDRSKCAPSTKNVIKFVALTGARCAEAREMEKKDIDFKKMIWTVPANKSKTNTKIIRPLSDEAARIINQQIALFGDFSEFVFPSQSYRNPISSQTVNKLCRSIRERLMMDDWTLHDFRRSISTILVDNGIEPYVTEKMLGHTLGGVFATYNKSNFIDEQSNAYFKWAMMLLH